MLLTTCLCRCFLLFFGRWRLVRGRLGACNLHWLLPRGRLELLCGYFLFVLVATSNFVRGRLMVLLGECVTSR